MRRMNWQEPVLDYCERLDGRFWAEPLNAASNAAFLVAAAAAYDLLRRRGGNDVPALALVAVTAAVGVGSFAFHTVATRGAMLLDVIPIAIFIYGYFLLALRRFFGLGALPAVGSTLLFGAAGYFIEASFHGLNGSIGYLPALAALLGFAGLLWAGVGPELPAQARRGAARGLAAAAATFVLSLTLRTVDRDICPAVPFGTHFLWHTLNACVLWLLMRTAILVRCEGQATPNQKASMPTVA
jgi:hypothetical protein